MEPTQAPAQILTDDLNASSEEFRKFINKLKAQVSNDDDNRTVWKNKMVTAVNQRLGVKKVTNRPYPGAPSIPLPESDKLIRKQKPNYVMSAYNQKKACHLEIDANGDTQMVTTDVKKAVERAEKALNYVILHKMDFLKKLAIAADNFLEKGHCLFKVIDQFTSMIKTEKIDLTKYAPAVVEELRAATDEELVDFLAMRYTLDPEDDNDKESIDSIIKQFRSGEDIIEFEYEKINWLPDVVVPPAERVIVPTYTTDIESAERITHEYFLTERQMLEYAQDGRFSKKVLDNLDKLKMKPTNETSLDLVEAQQARNEGLSESTDKSAELYRIWETCCWYKPEGEKRYKRWVFTYLADSMDSEDGLLQKRPFVGSDDTWDFVKHDNESKSWRYLDSRGIPEMIRALQEFMERSMNNMLIRDDINNAPVYSVLTSSKIQSNTMRFIPGQKLKVTTHDEIRRVDDGLSHVDQSSQVISQTLKAYAEEYLGSNDQLFRNQTNKGGGKTLGEIQYGISQAQALMSLDIMLWNETLRKLYTKIFYKLRDNLTENLVVEGTVITREDFQFVPRIVPTGSIESMDKQAAQQKALLRYQVISQEVQRGLVATPEDLYNALRDTLEADGVRDPDRYITDPNEIQQLKQQQAAQEQQMIDGQIADIERQQAQLAPQAESEMASGRTNAQPAR